MADEFSPERRRTRRTEPSVRHAASLVVARTVEVVDISVSGVALLSTEPIGVAVRGRLRTLLDRLQFDADVEVRWEQRADARIRSGAAFTKLDEGRRSRLKRFLKRETY